MTYDKESVFESDVIKMLSEKGWEKHVLKNYSEDDLIRNWANILFENNRERDKLNNAALTDGEIQQILEQIAAYRTPCKLNGFINGDGVTIKRDNPDDLEHLGKEVTLKIYDRREIAAGSSRYQIVQQPKFPTKSKILNDRRGDLMLLINGMPVIHIELKKSGIPVSQACNQIEKYSREGIFSGLFSLVQIFVAMTPEETKYFANPGPDGTFNPDFFFHWADVNNEPVNDWKQIVANLISIPMAHQLIGFYTVADGTDGVLKVMRSYQFFAASAISDRVAKNKWEINCQRGGHIWHTTGSGKTMTSFKSAQLIAASKDADKVIFLVDRIELGTQSANAYRNFATEKEDIQETENTGALVQRLKSSNPADTLIVTSIQKMSKIKEEDDGGLKAADVIQMQTKRIVFIVDECHRDTFGDMMRTIKQTFPKAIFFGFTGTPIHDENQKKLNTTKDIFGDELHRYSIADGIRDKNVLGFDPDKVLTYKDQDLRQAVALDKANAATVDEALADSAKKKIFYKYIDLPMAGKEDETGTYHKGIEDYIPASQYERTEHQAMVVKDIHDNWQVLSRNGKFHAIFATSSITEAIEYYRLLKNDAPDLKITALFDPNIDNNGGAGFKEDGLVEIISDYNQRYGQDFSLPTFDKMKKDISSRLAHKEPYRRIERTPDKAIDILIVVDQMLTGFDSKWINTLYLDKVLRYENLIQAFSRTNRLFEIHEKPFGKIKYYRYPHSMERNIEDAVKLYSGDKPWGLFAEKLDKNLENMNYFYSQIKDVFIQSGVSDFSELPKEIVEKQKFASLFRSFSLFLDAALIQDFTWKKLEYTFRDENGDSLTIKLALNEKLYKILVQRYKELSVPAGSVNPVETDVPYDLDGYLMTIDTASIDADYMNMRFEKYKKLLLQGNSDAVRAAEDELHKTFATLSQEDQKFANIFLHDIQRGDFVPEDGRTLRDYITEYRTRAKNDQIHRCASIFGIDEEKLRMLMSSGVTEQNINDYGRYDDLISKYDRQKAKSYFESLEGKKLIPPQVYPKVNNLLRDFILSGGYDLNISDGNQQTAENTEKTSNEQ